MNRKPTSSWLILNDDKINKLLKQLEISDFAGGYDGSVNLREIIRIVKGSKEEINILCRKVERLEIELEEEKKKK